VERGSVYAYRYIRGRGRAYPSAYAYADHVWTRLSLRRVLTCYRYELAELVCGQRAPGLEFAELACLRTTRAWPRARTNVVVESKEQSSRTKSYGTVPYWDAMYCINSHYKQVVLTVLYCTRYQVQAEETLSKIFGTFTRQKNILEQQDTVIVILYLVLPVRSTVVCKGSLDFTRAAC
jgi:hypothetical protein